MKETIVKNKETGETMKTKEGETLKDYTFEAGDKFIPSFNSVIRKENSYQDKTTKETKVAVTYLLKCKVNESEEEYFVRLTPTQAKTIERKAKDGIEVNQNIWTCYEYNHKEHGKQLGIGLQSNKKPIDWE